MTTHNILIIAPAQESRINTDVNLNGWQLDQLKYVALLLQVPLVPTTTVPDLPNPMRPFSTRETSVPPLVPRDAPNSAASYGLDDEAAAQMAAHGGALCILPGAQGKCALYNEVVQTAQKWQISAELKLPKNIIVLNGAFTMTAASSAFRNTLDRPTRIYSLGHDLMSLTTRWHMRPIWERGGLVTFSPSFLLFNYDRLGPIMRIIRTDPNWAAYIHPSTMIWLNEHMKRKSPNPVASFAALTSSLFFDDNLLRLAGTMSAQTSGLAVSCAPPDLPQRAKCTLWVDWLGKVFNTTEYEPLVELCREWANHTGAPGADSTVAEVDETSWNDLVVMRTIPHIVPYRRCIYIGSVCPKVATMASVEKGNRTGVELITADSFESVYAGVS